jgi:uncharacterized protein (TIGR02284 family)
LALSQASGARCTTAWRTLISRATSAATPKFRISILGSTWPLRARVRSITQGRGVGVFAISPSSLAAKENRNGSRRTLLAFLISGEFPMSSPSKDLKETESALRSVIQSLIDGQEGFKKIGEQIKDEALKEYFLAESLTRAQFRGVLESILHQEGVHDIKESGTAVGTVRRAWGDFKSALGGGDTSLLSTAEEAEDEAAEAYARATESYVPLPVRQVLTTQAAHIEKSHEFIKAARDTKK